MGRFISPIKLLIYLSQFLVLGFFTYLIYPNLFSYTSRIFSFLTSELFGPFEGIADHLNVDDYIFTNENDFKNSENLSISEDQILRDRQGVENLLTNDVGGEICPLVPSTLVGYMKPATIQPTSLEEVENILKAENQTWRENGSLLWQPLHCSPRHLVAILVPVRNRTSHLLTFLRHMHPFLQRQQIGYGLFVIEQSDKGKFNRAKLLNVGFVEAMAAASLSRRKFDCVVFHDVDHLPEDDRNLYVCPEGQALQLAVAVDIDNYSLTYANFFGAVSAMSARTFELVNGFSNMYWGWGGEDDDMSERLNSAGLRIGRALSSVGRYTTLAHHQQTKSLARWEMLDGALRRMDFDGLNSLHYKRLALKQTSLMTHILVDIVSLN